MENKYPTREHIWGIVNILKELNPKLIRNASDYPVTNEIWVSSFSKEGQHELAELFISMGLKPQDINTWETSMSIYYGDPFGPSIHPEQAEPTVDS